MDWPVLASLPAEERRRLVARLRRRAYRRDEVIFHQDCLELSLPHPFAYGVWGGLIE